MNGGILNMLKPPGMTSHDVVSYIRKVYGIRRVGHAGTLDPAAAGVLPVAVGQATRFLEYITTSDKSYRVEMTLGYESDTGDDTGVILARSFRTIPERQYIQEVLLSFIGDSEQLPPMYSAVKVDGRKLYEFAREGLEIERKARVINISEIEILEIKDNKVLFDVTCSKGTYIRSLCIDIGRKLGCFATMSFLVRTKVGRFYLQEAKTLEELAGDPQAALFSPDAFIDLPVARLTDTQAIAFSNGKTIEYISPGKGLFKVFNFEGTFVGIGRKEKYQLLKPVKVLSCIKQS